MTETYGLLRFIKTPALYIPYITLEQQKVRISAEILTILTLLFYFYFFFGGGGCTQLNVFIMIPNRNTPCTLSTLFLFVSATYRYIVKQVLMSNMVVMQQKYERKKKSPVICECVSFFNLYNRSGEEPHYDYDPSVA